MNEAYPTLSGKKLFRKDELIYINRSDELEEFCEIIHKHDFIEIAYIVEGCGIHVVGKNQYEISKGDLFVINYDVPHGFFIDKNKNSKTIIYNCVFMPEFLDYALLSRNNFQDIATSFLFRSLFPDEYNLCADLKLNGTEFDEIGSLFYKMYTEYKAMQKGYLDILRAYLIELIIKIFRYVDNQKQKMPVSRNFNIVNKALEYLRQNYNSDVRLEDLAMKSFISKNYFSKLFKEVTGTNFTDYVQQLRIDQAISLLKTTDMKIVDIAYNVGFKDIKFFYHTFKKITGKTPKDYRKKY